MLGFGALGELALGEGTPTVITYVVYSVEVGIIDTSPQPDVGRHRATPVSIPTA